MNYLKTVFPITNTLQNHLRQYAELSEYEIIESTKHFPYTILVCDKSAPGSPFNGGSAPVRFKFKELFDIARKKRQHQGHLCIEDSLNTMPWFRFHKTVGDALVRYFLEVACVFRALTNDECPNFVVQIAGVPVFTHVQSGRSMKKVHVTKVKRKKPKKAVLQKSGEGASSTGDIGLKRKKNRRGKKRKLRKNDAIDELPAQCPSNAPNPSIQNPNISIAAIPIGASRKLASTAFRVLARRFLHAQDLRERFIGSTHPIAKSSTLNQSIDKSILEKTFGFDADDLYSISSIQILMPILNRWVKMHKRCKSYGPILDQFCPLDESLLDESTEKEHLSTLVQNHCSKIHARRALECVFFRVIPMELFGENNTARLLNAMINFVVNAGRYDSTSLHQLATVVKTSKCAWLKVVKNNALRQHFLLRILNLVVRYLLCVVSSCFFVTESQSHKNRLFFYRKPIWFRITKMASQEFKRKCQLVPIDKTDTCPSYGPFSLRWIPKSCGEVRPIICPQNGQRRCTAFGGSVKMMNNDLKPILAIAQDLARRKPEIMGHSTSGFTDIYTRWTAYVSDQGQNQSQSKPYYMVKADVSACFDSINQNLLWNIVEKALSHTPEQFKLQAHWLIRSTSALSDCPTDTAVTNRRFRYSVRPSNRELSLARYYTELETNSASSKSGKASSIVVSKGEPFVLSKQTVAEKLKRLIFRRVLSLNGDRRKYIQTLGIAQGSSLSVLLCNVYLAELERKYLDPLLVRGEDLLMRHMDDFFYITPCLERAANFSDTLSNGFPEFNCYFKLEKTVTNFANPDHQPTDCAITKRIPWCGLLFNANSLNVLIDHNRLRSINMRDYIVVDFSNYPPSYVVKKLLHYLRTRTYRIALDKTINTPLSLRKNVQILTEFISNCYGAYVRAYDRSFPSDDRAKYRLSDQNFVKELARRVCNALKRRLLGLPKDIIRIGDIEKEFFMQLE